MTGISKAYGTLTFDEDFFDVNEKLIRTYFALANLYCGSGIVITGDGDYTGTFNFQNIEPWSTQRTLKNALRPSTLGKRNDMIFTEQQTNALFEKLYQKLYVSKTAIEFDIRACYDSAKQITHEIVKIWPTSINPYNKGSLFDVEEIASANLDYNDSNIMIERFADGYYIGTKDSDKKLREILSDWRAQQNQVVKSVDELMKILEFYADYSREFGGAYLASRFADNDSITLLIDNALGYVDYYADEYAIWETVGHIIY